MTFTFANCRFDTGTRRLHRGDAEVHLSPKAFDLLQLLIERRPLVVRKADLLERLWPGTFVTEGNLANLVLEIRRAIGDTARQAALVRTVPRVGYAFSGVVAQEQLPPTAPSTTHWLTGDAGEFTLRDGENVIGRDASAAIRLDSPRVSRRHAAVLVQDGVARLVDLGSTNGTYLRGRRLDAPERLADGDEVRVGRHCLRYRAFTPQASTEIAPGGTQVDS